MVSASIYRRQSYPACAIPCIEDADLGTCASASDEDECLCNDSAFIASTTSCIEGACTGADLASAVALAQAACAA
ncbi:hypothetical protein FIBSPDRAFT_777106, partial [Athelia psychrophila]